MEVKKVLFVAQEIEPYVAVNALSTFSRNLAQKVQEHGTEVRTFMPKYGAINERRNQLHEVIRLSGLNIIIDDTDHPLIIKVATLQPSRLQVYFIDNDDFFMRHPSGKLETEHDAQANDERSIFFVRGTAETVKKLRWQPSVLHCIGWMSALTPLYIKTNFAEDPVFANTKIIYSLFGNSENQEFNERFAEKLLADGFTAEQLKNLASGKIDIKALNKLAIDYSDAITFSSDDIDPELIEYARNSGKPILEYQKPEIIEIRNEEDEVVETHEDPHLERYYQFYQSL